MTSSKALQTVFSDVLLCRSWVIEESERNVTWITLRLGCLNELKLRSAPNPFLHLLFQRAHGAIGEDLYEHRFPFVQVKTDVMASIVFMWTVQRNFRITVGIMTQRGGCAALQECARWRA